MFVVCWWPLAQGTPRRDEYRIYAEMLQLHPNRRRESSSSVIPRLQPCERRRAQQAPKGPSGRKFFSKFTSPQQSYAAALCQDKQHQQPQTTQTEQQYLPQEEFQKTVLSVQSPSSSDNDKLKVATEVRQIVKELSEAVSEEDKVMTVTMIILDLIQQNGY
jgi:hypothetical protein